MFSRTSRVQNWFQGCFRIAAAAIAIGLVSLQPAKAAVDFSEMVTFGDSLTHNDLLGIVYGNPQDMYGDDPFEAVWEKGAVSGNTLTNYAVAGSTSDDLSTQIGFYDFLRLIGSQDDATLVGMEIGGNDVLNNIGLLKAYAPGENAQADAVIDDLIANFRSALLEIYNDQQPGTRYILWTIPDVTWTPEQINSLTEPQKENVRAHVQRVNKLIRAAGRYNFIVVADLYLAIQVLAQNPPVIKGESLLPPPAQGEYNAIFADDIHPTAVSNAILANYMITLINRKWNDNIPLYSEDELAALARIQ